MRYRLTDYIPEILLVLALLIFVFIASFSPSSTEEHVENTQGWKRMDQRAIERRLDAMDEKMDRLIEIHQEQTGGERR